MLLFIYYFLPESIVLEIYNQRAAEEKNMNIWEEYFMTLCVFFKRNDIENQIIFQKNHYDEIYFEFILSGKKYGFISYLKADRIIIENDDEAIRIELHKFDYRDWQDVLQRYLYERFANKKSTY